MTCPLTAHGPRARTRRYTRALAGWALRRRGAGDRPLGDRRTLVAAGGRPRAGCPIALALAADRYRNLGHAVAGGRLVAGHGSLIRRRSAVAAEGIIGWNVERSFFQRRAGLATLTATTAAGEQHYDVQDVEIGEALRVAEELLPGLAAPFLERAG